MTASTSPTPFPQRVTDTQLQPLAAAKSPVGPGAVAALGLVLAIGLLCLGAVGIHDAFIASGVVKGSSWIATTAAGADGLTPAAWMVPAGVAVLAAGVWAMVTALRPRPRTAIAVAAQTGVYLRPRDVARLARTAAEDVDGVTSAGASASRRTVTVSVRATSAGQVAEHVDAAVGQALSALATAPKIRVRVTPDGGSR